MHRCHSTTVRPRVVWIATLACLTRALALSADLHAQQPSSSATTSAGAPAGGAPVSLTDLVREAREHNPEIAASVHAWQASANAAKQASALPDTAFTLQQFAVGSPRPFAGYATSDFAYIGLGVSQEIPYPGKRGLRGQVAEHEADSRRAESDSVARQVIEALSLAYVQLAAVQQTLPILDREGQLLSQVEQIAESRYRVGQGSQQDVLEAQLQRTKLLQDVAVQRQAAGVLEAQLKQLLSRPQDSPDIVTDPLAASPVSQTASELLQRARDDNPDLEVRSAMVKREAAQLDLARRDSKPDFTAAYMYQHTGGRFPDYYMATVGLRLPNRSRERAAVAEAQESQARAGDEASSELQRVLSEVQQQYVMIQTSTDQLTIYRDGLLPQSEAAFRAGLAAYQDNRQDFESVLSSLLDVLNLNLAYVHTLADHESAVARLERLTGAVRP